MCYFRGSYFQGKSHLGEVQYTGKSSHVAVGISGVVVAVVGSELLEVADGLEHCLTHQEQERQARITLRWQNF